MHVATTTSYKTTQIFTSIAFSALVSSYDSSNGFLRRIGDLA